MIITNIEKQKNNSKRYSVFLDDIFAFGIDEIDLLYYKIELNKNLSQKDYDFIINNLILKKAKEKALKYLSYRMRAKSQVIKKLQEEEFPEKVISEVILFLQKYNYINDENFCKAYIHDKMNMKGYGTYKISYELKSLGIEEKLFEKFLLDDNFTNELEKAKSLLRKKIKNIDYLELCLELINNNNLDNNNYKQKQKLFNYLLRRGFSYDNINKAFNQLLEELSHEQY